ncbi:hypothetical protein M5K25_022994 [Dendrobium thyrsiflorum]|uniref:Uncharacterized protein n=1 Tax=Dendrobium thyrsiflorum TaxID=117978 RepID=A0ABD0UDQ3_DENTH
MASLGVRAEVRRHLEAGRKSSVGRWLGGRPTVVEEYGGKRALFLLLLDSFSSLLLFFNASDASDAEAAGNIRKRRWDQELNQQQQQQQHVMAGYTTALTQGLMPTPIWSAGGGASASGEPVWPFAQMGAATMFRGSMSAGLHFMNFPAAPMALLPGQQLGLGSGSGAEGHLGILAALNSYRPVGSGHEAAATTHHHHYHQQQQQQHHSGGGGSERNDTMSTSDS